MSKRPTKRAWAMLGEMKDSGEFCCIDLSADYDLVWDVVVSRADLQNTHTKSKLGSGPSYSDISRAIEDAYNAWLGIEEGDYPFRTATRSW